MSITAPTEISNAPASAEFADRAAVGREARRRVPRSTHGEWSPAADRADPSRSSKSRPPPGCRNSCPSGTRA